MIRRHFETRAALQRQMDATRQLRVEILTGALWTLRALAGAALVIRRMVLRIAACAPRRV